MVIHTNSFVRDTDAINATEHNFSASMVTCQGTELSLPIVLFLLWNPSSLIFLTHSAPVAQFSAVF